MEVKFEVKGENMKTREEILTAIHNLVAERKTLSDQIKAIWEKEIMERRRVRSTQSADIKSLVKELRGLKKAERKVVVKAPKVKVTKTPVPATQAPLPAAEDDRQVQPA